MVLQWLSYLYKGYTIVWKKSLELNSPPLQKVDLSLKEMSWSSHVQQYHLFQNIMCIAMSKLIILICEKEAFNSRHITSLNIYFFCKITSRIGNDDRNIYIFVIGKIWMSIIINYILLHWKLKEIIVAYQVKFHFISSSNYIENDW